jgi:hypothetical protein
MSDCIIEVIKLFVMCLLLPQLTLTVGDKIWSFLTNEDPGSSEVDAMVQALATAIRNIFPTVPLT